MHKGLTFVPSGGLANRMCAIVSAINLCNRTHLPLNVYWFCDWGMGARFEDVFNKIPETTIVIKEASFVDKLTVDRPRKHNLYFPMIYQRLFFTDAIKETQIPLLNSSDFDFEKWVVRGAANWMSSYDRFGNIPDFNVLVNKYFVPNSSVMDTVRSYTGRFTEYTVGIHIRRTDNIQSIQHSSLEKFIAAAEMEVSGHPDVSFFLATDDDFVKRVMCDIFGSRIITRKCAANRSSVSGIQNAAAEMWALAATKKILGSYGSTYSKMASIVGGIDITIII